MTHGDPKCARVRSPAGLGRISQGVLAGAAAWWAMDRFLRFAYDRQSERVKRREAYVRGRVPALEVLAEDLSNWAHRPLTPSGRQRAGTLTQWIVGIGGGVIYALLRDRLPGRGLARGLGYGAAFSLVVDEGLVPLLGLAPPAGAFPWQTHARGFAGHLVYGVAVEAALRSERLLPLRSSSRGL